MLYRLHFQRGFEKLVIKISIYLNWKLTSVIKTNTALQLSQQNFNFPDSTMACTSSSSPLTSFKIMWQTEIVESNIVLLFIIVAI